MRKRRGAFEDLFNLPIGSELAVEPNPGETTEAALKRLKLWASKQKGRDRAYRMRVDAGLIRIQRTPLGRNTPLSDWLLMKPGDRMLLKSSPNAADRKKATNTVDYLNGFHMADSPRRREQGSWSAGLDARGRLVVFCFEDLDGDRWGGRCSLNGPAYAGWNGEWP